MVEKYYMQWTEYDAMVLDLFSRIKVEYNPTHIVGVGRGGLTLAVSFSHLFELRMSPIIIQSYVEGDKGIGQQQEVFYEENLEILDKIEGSILIAEDLTETGLTLIRIRDRLMRNSNVENFKFVTLFHKLSSKLVPDFYYQITDKWICFPGEKDYYENKYGLDL